MRRLFVFCFSLMWMLAANIQAAPTVLKGLPSAVGKIAIDDLGGIAPVVTIEKISSQMTKVCLEFTLPSAVSQDDWRITITPSFTPVFNWAPHLTPEDKNVIDQHVFRSPAMIMSDKSRVLTVIPDGDIINEGTPVRWYMDLNAPAKTMTLGMSKNRVSEHVLYERVPGAIFPAGKIKYGFYLISSTKKEDVANPFRAPLAFMWEKWGTKEYANGNPLSGEIEPYVKHTYNWAFNPNAWGKAVWQQFRIGDKEVGAPAFIVNTTQSPNYPGWVNEREFRSIWNQAWFNSMRSASGLYRYARRTNNAHLMEKANMTKELALSSPMKEGLFYTVISTPMETVNIDGKKINRSTGWDNYRWGNSNRNPYTSDAVSAPFHVLDMSWTALLMMRWYDELEKDQRLIDYTKQYADALLKLQDEKGYFPAWIDSETLEVRPLLSQSPETAMSVTFLLELAKLTGEVKYKKAALKALDVIVKEIVPVGRWEDFETYWSCSRYNSEKFVGNKIARNDMYKQCNLSIFWTTEALLTAYQHTETKKYLEVGHRVLDELLMTQSSWQPYYIYVPAVGGFGVMNMDGEWNDSRCSLFSELILNYGKLFDCKEYNERGIAALKASFVMMYCPENPKSKALWEKVWPFFNERDYGFTMENYGHGGATSPEGEGVGEFTIYDWGNGAASETYNKIIDRYGNIFEK